MSFKRLVYSTNDEERRSILEKYGTNATMSIILDRRNTEQSFNSTKDSKSSDVTANQYKGFELVCDAADMERVEDIVALSFLYIIESEIINNILGISRDGGKEDGEEGKDPDDAEIL